MRKKLGIAALTALVISIAASAILWAATPDREQALIPSDAESIYPDSEYYTYGYHIESNHFTPYHNDPQIGFMLSGQELRSVVIEFADPLEQDTVIDVYYASNQESLSEEKRINITAEERDTVVAIELPNETYTNVRLDINGSFVLSGVYVSRSEPVFRSTKSDLILKESFLVGALTFLLSFLPGSLLITRLKAYMRYAKGLFPSEDQTESQKAKRDILWALGVTLLAALFFLVVIPARYEINDDLAMSSIAHGHHGLYNSYLLFINVVIGKLIKWCLMAVPAAPWYTIFQVALICASFAILLYLIFQHFGIQSVFPAALLLSYFGYEFISRIQFTKTAGISVAAGFLLLFDAIKNRRSVFAYLIGGGMAAAGSMYRFSVFEMLCIPFFGVGVQMLWEYGKERDAKKLLRLCIPFVAVFAVCFGLRALDSWAYQRDARWAAYREFNSLRAQMTDYGFPNYQENQALYESLGISQNDYNMYRGLDIADPERFNIENLRQLVDAKEPRQFSWALVRRGAEEITLGFLQYRYICALLIVLFVCLMFIEKRRLFLLFYLCASFWFVQLYLCYVGRYLKNRVDVCMILAVTMIVLLYLFPRSLFNQRRIAMLMAGVLLMMALPQYLDYLTVKREYSERYPVKLIHSDLDHLYMGSISDGGGYFTTMWDPGPLGMLANFASTIGWKVNSPYYQPVWDAYGIEVPYRDIVDNPDVYLICNSGLEQKLERIREYYAPEANAYCVKIINGVDYIYRIATSEVPPEGIEYAEDGEGIDCGVSIRPLKDNYVAISGFLYKEGTNSFASNIYIALRTPDNEEHFYYTTQRTTDFSVDPLNDPYSVFSRELEAQQPGTSVVLYLETDDAIYRVETGASL